MKFLEVFRFEIAYQLRRPWPWMFFCILLAINFLMTRDNSLSEALYDEFLVNSPFAIAKTTVFGTLIWLVIAPVITGSAAARDFDTRMHPLLFTSSLTKRDYLAGRFLAAFICNALLLLAVQFGIAMAIYSPGVDPKLIGPFRFVAYLTAYGYISIPNAFAATAIQFCFSSRTGRPMASYLASVLLIFMGFFVATIVLWKRGLGTLLDPIGIRFIVEDIAHLWTTVEKSWRLLEMDGIIFENRMFWMSIGVCFIAYSYFRFQFTQGIGDKRLRLKAISDIPKEKQAIPSSTNLSGIPSIDPVFDFKTACRKVMAIAWSSASTLARSWAGLALLLAIPLLTIPVVVDQMQSGGGVLVPTTIRVIRELTGSLSEELSRWVIIPAFIIYFAGELVWRERDARIDEMVDALPGSDWNLLIGKYLGLVVILVVFTLSQIISGTLAQSLMGYKTFEVALYFKILFGLQFPEYLLFAALAITIHVMVNQKYTGHMVAILVYVFIALSSLFGVEHNMLVFGAGPAWSYTDMRGFGSSLSPWLWFKIYWTSWSFLLTIAARLLWVRGRENALLPRLQLARNRFHGSLIWFTSVAFGITVAVGAFIFYNTNILNDYSSHSGQARRQAEYEIAYRRYKDVAQPRLHRVALNVEIFPADHIVEIHGLYVLKNANNVPLDSIIVTTSKAIDGKTIKLNKPVNSVISDDAFGHTLIVLKQHLMPGDSLNMRFKGRFAPRGFREDGVDQSVAENGTFFNNDWFPIIGYAESRELISASDRRKYNLPPRPLIASLYDTVAIHDRGEGVKFEAVLGTSSDQIAGAPGELLKTWSRGDRSYFHYRSSGPIGGEWAFFSANYVVHEEIWSVENGDDASKPITIRIYHMPEHRAHVANMMQSIRASLTYYSEQFGPYPYTHLTVAERPGDGTGLHADASILTHSEGFSLWNASDDPQGVNFPFAVVAHEMGHQWTVPYANVEGAPVMSESIAWYYAMKVVEQTKGISHLRALLATMRQPYPIAPIRRGEPLLRGMDKYLSYRRGPFALYTISEYVGEERVNSALRTMLQTHRQKGSALATTLDLYHHLKAVTPDSLTYLLHDLFEVNTFWQLSLKSAATKQNKSGSWDLTLTVDAKKVVADSAGVEQTVPTNDWIEIGVFTDAGEGQKDEALYLKKHHITSGQQIIKLTVQQQPTRAGIDPHHLLIDLKTDDNMRQVKSDDPGLE